MRLCERLTSSSCSEELEEETQKAVMATLEERVWARGPCASLPFSLLGAVRAEATRERAVEDVQRTCKQNMQTEMTKLEQNLSEQPSGIVSIHSSPFADSIIKGLHIPER